ncbi:MAG: MFS transporter [Solirubrobacteraceae bacterium]
MSALQDHPATKLHSPRLGVDAHHDSYKWWALSCTCLGMLLATVNSGTLIIALPDLERSLHTSLLELVWVILVYMIASTVLVLSAGRLSDQFGRKRAYIGGFVLFALASLGAGFAGNGTELILWRILQGVGGSFLFANAAAIVTDAFPREQLGLAMGTNTMVAAVGLVIGPVLGGALVLISWPWVFWFNVPFALAGSVWAAMILREQRAHSEDRAFDVAGTVTFLIGLTGLVFGVSKGGLSGWGSPLVIGGLIAAAVLLPAFVLVERHRGQLAQHPASLAQLPSIRPAPAPMLDLTIFTKSRLFSAAAGAAFINGLARFALMFVFVFYFQGVQGNSPILAGLKLAPLALGMLVSSPLAGVWADRRGSRTIAVLGMLVTAAGLALMTTLGRDTTYIESGAYLFVVGVGSGMFNSPNTAAMMGAVSPQRRGIAAGARVLVQNTGAVLSIAFVLAVITSSVPKAVLFKVFSGLADHISTAELNPFIANMHLALWCLAAISILGAGVAAARPAHTQTRDAPARDARDERRDVPASAPTEDVPVPAGTAPA